MGASSGAVSPKEGPNSVRRDIKGELKNLSLDLPEGALVYGDKAYGNDSLTEDLRAEAAQVGLVGQRRKHSRRPRPAWVSYVLEHFRKRIGTAFSEIERRRCRRRSTR